MGRLVLLASLLGALLAGCAGSPPLRSAQLPDAFGAPMVGAYDDRAALRAMATDEAAVAPDRYKAIARGMIVAAGPRSGRRMPAPCAGHASDGAVLTYSRFTLNPASKACPG